MKISKYQQTFIDAIKRSDSGDRLILRQRCRGRRMTQFFYLNDDHTYRACELFEWCGQFEEMSKQGVRHVADDLVDDCRVSTVWLGMNHNYFGGIPLLFETMVFKGDSGNDIYCDRYTTWDEAENGHKKAVEWVKAGCLEED